MMPLVTKKYGLDDDELARFRAWRRAQRDEEEQEEEEAPSRTITDEIPTLPPEVMKRWDAWANALIGKAISKHTEKYTEKVIIGQVLEVNVKREIERIYKDVRYALAHDRKVARLEITKAVVRLLARKTPEELAAFKRQKHVDIVQLERELAAMEK